MINFFDKCYHIASFIPGVQPIVYTDKIARINDLKARLSSCQALVRQADPVADKNSEAIETMLNRIQEIRLELVEEGVPFLLNNDQIKLIYGKEIESKYDELIQQSLIAEIQLSYAI